MHKHKHGVRYLGQMPPVGVPLMSLKGMDTGWNAAVNMHDITDTLYTC